MVIQRDSTSPPPQEIWTQIPLFQEGTNSFPSLPQYFCTAPQYLHSAVQIQSLACPGASQSESIYSKSLALTGPPSNCSPRPDPGCSMTALCQASPLVLWTTGPRCCLSVRPAGASAARHGVWALGALPCSEEQRGPAQNSNLNLDAIRGNQPNALWQLLPQDCSRPAKGIRVIIQSLDF